MHMQCSLALQLAMLATLPSTSRALQVMLTSPAQACSSPQVHNLYLASQKRQTILGVSADQPHKQLTLLHRSWVHSWANSSTLLIELYLKRKGSEWPKLAVVNSSLRR